MSLSPCDCECIGGGWCTRHTMRKPAHWVNLCRTDPAYFLAWEEGRGPGQKTPRGMATLATSTGPGTELSRMIGHCIHYQYASQMNRWGVDGCAERIELLVRWLQGYACQHSQCMSQQTAERMVRLAIERARENACHI